jgi:hypothetical protein
MKISFLGPFLDRYREQAYNHPFVIARIERTVGP